MVLACAGELEQACGDVFLWSSTNGPMLTPDNARNFDDKPSTPIQLAGKSFELTSQPRRTTLKGRED